MPIKTKDDQGNEIEVFTQAELEEQATARAEAAAQQAREAAEQEKQEALEKLEQEKQELQSKLNDKNINWKQLREKADGKSGDVEEVKKQMEVISKRLEELGQMPVKTAKENFISANLPEDKDKREKFEYYYNKLSYGYTKPEEFKKAMEEALAIVLPGQKPNMDYQMYTGRVDRNYIQPSSTERSEAHKAFADAFGLSDEDHKKYGKKN